MRPCTLAITFGILASLPFPIAAQAPDGSPRHQASFEQLHDHQWVRVSAPGTGRREGRLLEHRGNELVLRSGSQPLRLRATAVDTLWTRGGSSRAGAIVGAVIGGALGLVAGTELGEENAGSAGMMLGAGGIRALGGGLLGAIFGAVIPSWKRVIP